MKKLAWLGVALVAALAANPARAEDAPSSRAERERIARQRQAAEVQFAQREAECRQRFVVTSCIDKARADRRQTLDNLHQQEIALDEVERRQRSAEHRRRRDARAWEEINKPAPEPKPPREPKLRAPKAVAKLPDAAASRPAPVDRSAEEQRSRERFEARKREAEEHRAEVEKRNRERADKKAKPLPPPSAASAP